MGKKCVAAHSADTPPVLMTLGAQVDISGPAGDRTVLVRDFFVADGIWNTSREPGEIVTRIRVPLPEPGAVAADVALGARPKELTGWEEVAEGEALAERAYFFVADGTSGTPAGTPSPGEIVTRIRVPLPEAPWWEGRGGCGRSSWTSRREL